MGRMVDNSVSLHIIPVYIYIYVAIWTMNWQMRPGRFPPNFSCTTTKLFCNAADSEIRGIERCLGYQL